jgi:hypothetical protein
MKVTRIHRLTLKARNVKILTRHEFLIVELRRKFHVIKLFGGQPLSLKVPKFIKDPSVIIKSGVGVTKSLTH